MDTVKCVTCERSGSGSCGPEHHQNPAAANAAAAAAAAAFLTAGMGPEQSPFFATPGGGLELKENVDARWTLPYPSMYCSYDGAVLPGYPFVNGYRMDLNGARRKNATRETTSTLKAWLNEHRKNPYPTKAEKIMLAILTQMTLTQVSTWFANARRRLKKENKMTWSPRNRCDDDDGPEDDVASNVGASGGGLNGSSGSGKDSVNGDNGVASGVSVNSNNNSFDIKTTNGDPVRDTDSVSTVNGYTSSKVKDEGDSDIVDIEEDSTSGIPDSARVLKRDTSSTCRGSTSSPISDAGSSSIHDAPTGNPVKIEEYHATSLSHPLHPHSHLNSHRHNPLAHLSLCTSIASPISSLSSFSSISSPPTSLLHYHHPLHQFNSLNSSTPSNKPKIWSIVDTATSKSTSTSSLTF